MTQRFNSYITCTILFFSMIMTLVSGGILLVSMKSEDKFPLIIVFTLTLIIFLLILISRSQLRAAYSPELFFIIVALGGVSFEAFRSLVYLSGTMDLLYKFYNFFPRLVYFGKMVSALALFVSGLFPTGFSIHKQNTFLGLIILFSLLLATSIPIDTSVGGTILLPGSTDPYMMQRIIYSLYIIAFLNYAAGSYLNRNRNYLLTGIGVFLLSVGIELTFPLVPGFTAAAGLLLLPGGTYLASFGIRKIYSWI